LRPSAHLVRGRDRVRVRVRVTVRVGVRVRVRVRVRVSPNPNQVAAPARALLRVRVGLLRPAAATRGGEGADDLLVAEHHASHLHALEEPERVVRRR